MRTLARAAAFFAFASALWTMLPLVAREVLAGGPTLYGVLLGCVGAGTVAGAVVLPAVRRRLGPDRTVAAGTLGTAAAMATFAVAGEPAIAAVASLVAGVSWIAVLSSLNVSAQISLPDWVRARGLSVFLTVFFGSMAAGSMAWGLVYGWSLMQDAADPESFAEASYEPSWAGHLRHHERVSGADRDLQARIGAMHLDEAPPEVRHFLPPAQDGRA